MCSPIPEHMLGTNVIIIIQSIAKIFFIGFLFYIDDAKFAETMNADDNNCKEINVCFGFGTKRRA